MRAAVDGGLALFDQDLGLPLLVPQELADVARFGRGVAFVLAQVLGMTQTVTERAVAEQGVAAVRLFNGAAAAVRASHRNQEHPDREGALHRGACLSLVAPKT